MLTIYSFAFSIRAMTVGTVAGEPRNSEVTGQAVACGNDGPAICLNGNAGDEDTDHNIAHQNDGIIEARGNMHSPAGTLPIGEILGLSVEAAKAAAPSDADCQSKIDAWTGIDKYGGDPSALVRSSNDPPAFGSPAQNYFYSPKPIR
jgi:hypothetical protein